MARFTLPRDLYHGKGALEALKSFTGKKAMICVGGGSMMLGGDGACGTHVQQRHLKALFFQLLQCVQHRVVLEGGGDDVLLALALTDAGGGDDSMTYLPPFGLICP